MRRPGFVIGALWRSRSEDGLLGTMLAVAVALTLTVTASLVVQMASITHVRTTVSLGQAQALASAESGLDQSYVALQTATTLPCGSGAETKQFTTTYPNTSSYSVSITYYTSSGTPLTCPLSSTPADAVLISMGTAGGTTQYMEADVGLTFIPSGTVFNDALFSNATMTGSNNPTVYGYTGDDATIYTNGSVVCGNNFVLQGATIAQGGFTGNNNCSVAGNVSAVGNIALQNNTVIGGNAISSGSSGCTSPGTQGSITMQNNATVSQSAYAYCTITLSNNASVVHTMVPNDVSLTNPTVQTFPTVPNPAASSSIASAWTAAGYTNQITVGYPTCVAGNQTTAYNDISAMSTATAPTLIVTACPLSWANNSTISLNQNLAIFSTGGFSMQNNTTWQSQTTATHLLYLMVPSISGSTTTTCTSGSPGITLQNNTTFASTLNVLYYTPCTVSISNNSAGYGQIYGGVINVQNNFTTHFVPLPTVPGSSGGGNTGPASTTIGIVYERQISSLSAA